MIRSNILLAPGNYHCKLIWNGKLGRHSEVKLEDHSSNGTWINNTHVKRGYQSILRGGAAISLGAAPDVTNNEYSKHASSSIHPFLHRSFTLYARACLLHPTRYVRTKGPLHPGFIFRDVEGQSTRHANQIWAKYDVGHE